MPQTGFCSDVNCKKELTQLYECHCCSCFICLNHLLKHVDIVENNKQRLENSRRDLLFVSQKLKTIVDKKLKQIEHENYLLSRANQMLNLDSCSIDEIQQLSDEINKIITFNHHEDQIIIQVDSSLSTDAFLIDGQSTENSDSVATEILKKLDTSRISLHEQTNIPFASNQKIDVLDEEILLSPITDRTTDENNLALISRRRFPCPLSDNMIDLFGCPPKSSKRIPCQSKLFLGSTMLAHLSKIHNIRPRIARPMIKTYEQNLNKMISTKDPRINSYLTTN